MQRASEGRAGLLWSSSATVHVEFGLQFRLEVAEPVSFSPDLSPFPRLPPGGGGASLFQRSRVDSNAVPKRTERLHVPVRWRASAARHHFVAEGVHQRSTEASERCRRCNQDAEQLLHGLRLY